MLMLRAYALAGLQLRVCHHDRRRSVHFRRRLGPQAEAYAGALHSTVTRLTIMQRNTRLKMNLLGTAIVSQRDFPSCIGFMHHPLSAIVLCRMPTGQGWCPSPSMRGRPRSPSWRFPPVRVTVSAEGGFYHEPMLCF